MTETSTVTQRSNPFSTRFVQPGNIEFLTSGDSISAIWQRFEMSNYLGQIVGPHGSGKTTLALTLAGAQSVFASVRRVTIRSRNLPALDSSELDLRYNGSDDRQSLWIVDGIERLNWLHRFLFLSHFKRCRDGLLLTTHKPLRRLQVVYRTSPSGQLFRRLVDELGCQFAGKEIDSAWIKHAPNVREALMELYDVWEKNK